MLADDHILMREGIRQLLEFDGSIDVVAEANDGEECIEKLLLAKPQILLLDINMHKKNRIEFLDKIDSLTSRELEVLIQVANGMFNKEIATSLNISERTVKNHISNIFKKIDVSDRTQAAVFAIKNDIIKLY